MNIKVIKFKEAITMPGTAAGATQQVRPGKEKLSYDDKLGVFVISSAEEETLVPWGNIAYVKRGVEKK